MENETIRVREGAREDMPRVLALIKELAEFERMSDEVRIDASVLVRDGFDTESPWFSTFVAEDAGGAVVGYALYYRAYSTWLGKSIFLEDLYVQPSHRGKRIGDKLFAAVAEVARNFGFRLDFHVLSWNPAVEFYKKRGAVDLTAVEKWHLHRLDVKALDALLK